MVVLSCATSAYPTHTMRMTSAKLPVCLSSAKMAVLSCATPACPTRTLRITSSIVPVYSSSRVSVHPSDSPFIPEVELNTEMLLCSIALYLASASSKHSEIESARLCILTRQVKTTTYEMII
ncbi:hypothetical protein FXO37_21751 [Capsicum annuum]|nr:hypothetical protein FXO37_21751 [Capsicum annuum]